MESNGLLVSVIGLLMTILNMLISARIRGEVSELKASIYRDFVTKDDFHQFRLNSNNDNAQRRRRNHADS